MKARKLLRQLKRLRPLGSVQPPGVSCDPLLRFEKPAFVELCLSNPSNHQKHRPILLNAKPCAALTALTLLIAARPGAARPKTIVRRNGLGEGPYARFNGVRYGRPGRTVREVNPCPERVGSTLGNKRPTQKQNGG